MHTDNLESAAALDQESSDRAYQNSRFINSEEGQQRLEELRRQYPALLFTYEQAAEIAQQLLPDNAILYTSILGYDLTTASAELLESGTLFDDFKDEITDPERIESAKTLAVQSAFLIEYLRQLPAPRTFKQRKRQADNCAGRARIH